MVLIMQIRCILMIILMSIASLSFAGGHNRKGGFTFKDGDWKGRMVEYAEGVLAVKFKPSLVDSRIEEIRRVLSARVIDTLSRVNWIIYEVDPTVDLFQKIEEIKSLKDVENAVPITSYQATTAPDEDYHLQWYLSNTGQASGTNGADIRAQQAWSITEGDSDVVIAILDSGIPLDSYGNLSHPDLNDQTFIKGPDLFYQYYGGYGFNVEPDGIRDYLGHGSHVAGLAGAEKDNTEGIAGVCPECQKLIIQVLGKKHILQPEEKDIYSTNGPIVQNAIEYAVDYGITNDKRVVINLSLGGEEEDPYIEDAIAYAQENDVFIIAAAGNNSYLTYYPALYASEYGNVVAVSATGNTDAITSWSSRGSYITVAAPGGTMSSGGGGDASIESIEGEILPQAVTSTYAGAIYSTYPPELAYYKYLVGTSMAAPLVAGVVGLMLSETPSLGVSDIKDYLSISADDVNNNGFDNNLGWGRLNAYQAVFQSSGNNCLNSPNGAPTLSVICEDYESPFLSWTYSNLCQLAGYKLYRAVNNPNNMQLIATKSASSTLHYTDLFFVKDPEGEMTAYYQVKAYNWAGTLTNASNQISITAQDNSSSNSFVVDLESLPDNFYLLSNYPNPFNPSTEIEYGIAEPSYVTLAVYDVLGREVARIVDANQNPGRYKAGFNAHSLPSGVYYYSLTAGFNHEMKKMMLLK